jgi:hypothetical protein
MEQLAQEVCAGDAVLDCCSGTYCGSFRCCDGAAVGASCCVAANEDENEEQQVQNNSDVLFLVFETKFLENFE